MFVTSSNNVPVGGFSNLDRKFTINYVAKSAALPVAHTCFITLDLPDYNNIEVLEEKLLFAISNTNTFDLK